MRYTDNDTTVDVYTATYTTGTTGIKAITAWTKNYDDMPIDFQPISKSPARLAEFGLDSIVAGSRIGYYDKDYTINLGMFIIHNNKNYMVSIQPHDWSGHYELIATPTTVKVGVV